MKKNTRFDSVKPGLALAIACFGLAACVSSGPNIASLGDVPANTNQQANNSQTSATSGEQKLVKVESGELIAVPIRNPQAIVAVAATDPSTKTSVENPSVVAASREQAPIEGDIKLAQSEQVSAPDQKTDDTTSELALITPQPSPLARENTSVDTKKAEPTNVASLQATQKQATAEIKKPSLLARFFSRPKANVGPRDDRSSPILKSSRTASRSNQPQKRYSNASAFGMPGVKPNSDIFGIKRQRITIDRNRNIRLASAGALGRLSPLSLKTQHSGVNVDCIRPEVVQLLNIVERHYGKKPVVTSGYRSPSRNRRAGGARNSMHIYCKAVDVQVEGVSKWNLAKFMRTIPGRGGIGTYCRTKSVHIDIGPKRDWHHSCRRKSKRRRRA